MSDKPNHLDELVAADAEIARLRCLCRDALYFVQCWYAPTMTAERDGETRTVTREETMRELHLAAGGL